MVNISKTPKFSHGESVYVIIEYENFKKSPSGEVTFDTIHLPLYGRTEFEVRKYCAKRSKARYMKLNESFKQSTQPLPQQKTYSPPSTTLNTQPQTAQIANVEDVKDQWINDEKKEVTEVNINDIKIYWCGQEFTTDGYHIVYAMPGPNESKIDIIRRETVTVRGWISNSTHTETDKVYSIEYIRYGRVDVLDPQEKPEPTIVQTSENKTIVLDDPKSYLLYNITNFDKKKLRDAKDRVLKDKILKKAEKSAM
jgi:hypothetical protein